VLSGTRYWMGHLPAAEELMAASTSRLVLRRAEGEHNLLRNHIIAGQDTRTKWRDRDLSKRLYTFLRSPQSMKRPLPAMIAAPSHVQ
jgi:hypothetical protein